jgi:hypothetical protein
MKKILFYSFLFLSGFGMWSGCQKGNNYPGGVISPYIPALDLRQIYQGTDVVLNTNVMYGSDKLTGVVISDHAGKNMPAGLLVVQDHRRLNIYRGIAINIGADAAKYVPGDSVVINLNGGTLTRANGILQVTNLSASNVTKVRSGAAVVVTKATTSQLLAKPADYESIMVAVVKGGFDPIPTAADKFSGDKLVNDGFDNITLHTEATATFANTSLPVSANFYGIVFNTVGSTGSLVPQLRLRNINDLVILSSDIVNVPFVISGFISDVIGSDGNYEYVQFIATKDIDFSVTPYSLVFCNNAGAATPLGFPANGWATGGTSTTIQFKTYKINMTSGTAKKGTFFYVGGTGKLINGPATSTLPASTSIASSNWIRNYDYVNKAGEGFGTAFGGILANSGNASGIAVFEGINVTSASTPIDCEFISTGGSLYTAGPPELGYRVANTDFYDTVDPITLKPQPYYRQGTNTLSLTYPAVSDIGNYYKLGGVYSARLGKWVKARSQTLVVLSKTSQINEIEGEFPAGVPATVVKD